jgi:uncharacterized protein YodC (DUF2158 family)
MTDSNSDFMACVKTEKESDCMKKCSWYKGSGVNTNPVLPTGTCDEVVVSGTTTSPVAGGVSICKGYKSESTCPSTCKWNPIDITNLIPTSVCMPNDMTKISD